MGLMATAKVNLNSNDNDKILSVAMTVDVADKITTLRKGKEA